MGLTVSRAGRSVLTTKGGKTRIWRRGDSTGGARNFSFELIPQSDWEIDLDARTLAAALAEAMVSAVVAGLEAGQTAAGVPLPSVAGRRRGIQTGHFRDSIDASDPKGTKEAATVEISAPGSREEWLFLERSRGFDYFDLGGKAAQARLELLNEWLAKVMRG